MANTLKAPDELLTAYQQLHLKEQLAEELSLSVDFNMGDQVDLAPNFLRIIQKDKYKPLFAVTKES